ncbi:NUDIX hydrolase [Nonomuraea angiospora]|uniref:hypothetical protein n=1 Tax=Nonomuraea angiospora TaxID=46172 RepID=UPI0029BF2089|nr:hypothetical protein [Nonomuraea angiospora]MDX3100510.1 hypothetical protein [Nonomuraea angiospora]
MTQPVDEIELAKRELTRRLTPYVATERAWSIGADYVTDLLARGWRPPLDRPPKPNRKGDYARGAALARELLAQRLQGADVGDSIPDPGTEGPAPKPCGKRDPPRDTSPRDLRTARIGRQHTRPAQNRAHPFGPPSITRRGQLGSTSLAAQSHNLL